jgi:ABC-type branched-subunit amino acid transport system substrate-binding protein
LLFKRGGPAGPAYFLDLCWPPAGFNERYREAFGQPTHGCRAALAYDAVRAVVVGLQALGPLGNQDLESALSVSRRRLRDALAKTDFTGLTGRVRFDRVGDRRTGMPVLVVEAGPDGPRTRLQSWVGE